MLLVGLAVQRAGVLVVVMREADAGVSGARLADCVGTAKPIVQACCMAWARKARHCESSF
eukprot:m.215103 g.215103  ORF g.215103 m.215103 type:complete len:60 (-) comp27584_c0_seq1:23-202(-)